MKKPIFLLPLFCLFIIQACNPVQETQDIEEVTELLTQYSKEWAEALKNKDGASVEGYFSPEMIYQGPDGTIQTKEDLIRDMNENANEIKSFSIEDVKVKLVGKDIAIVTGGGGQVWIDPHGEEQLYKSRFTNVWRTELGKWQCIAGHGNPIQYGDNESDLTKIKAVTVDATAAINSGDFEAWLDLFDEHAQIMFNGGKTLNGKEEMVAELNKSWGDPESDYSIEHDETILLGDYAFGIGTVKGTQKNPDTGKIEVVNDRETVLFKKQKDGEWKTFRLMVNQNQ